MNYNLVLLLAIVMTVYTVYRIYKTFSIKTLSVYQTFKKLSNYAYTSKHRIKKRDDTENLLSFLYRKTCSIKFLNHTEKRKNTLEYLSLRMNFKWNDVSIIPEYLQGMLDTATLFYIVITSILTLVDMKFIVFVLAYNFVPVIILEIFASSVKEYDKEVEEEFYRFHSCYYNLYKHKSNQNVPIPTVAQNCYNSVGPQLQRMIELMRVDFKTAENTALDNLKAHYRIGKVYRFCNEMKLIQSGRSVDLDMLEKFQLELDNEHRLKQQRVLAEKKIKAEGIMSISAFILVEVIIFWSACAVLLNK